jgi:hypothetical protein
VGYLLNLEAAESTNKRPLVDLLLVPRIKQKLVPTEDKTYLAKMLFTRPEGLPKYIAHPIPRHLLKKGRWKEVSFEDMPEETVMSVDEDTAPNATDKAQGEACTAMPGAEMKLLELGYVRVTKNGLIIRKFNPGKLSPLTTDGREVFPSGRELRWFHPDVKTLFNIDLPQPITVSHGRPVVFREGDRVGMLGGPAETPLEYGGTLLDLHGKGIWNVARPFSIDQREMNNSPNPVDKEGEFYTRNWRYKEQGAQEFQVLEGNFVKFFSVGEYVSSEIDGATGMVVHIDYYGVATLLVKNKSVNELSSWLRKERRRGRTRQEGLDEHEEDMEIERHDFQREQELRARVMRTEEMLSKGQDWVFDWESSELAGSQLANKVFGQRLSFENFSVLYFIYMFE